MKKIIVLTALLVMPALSQASTVVQSCSNSDGTLKYVIGAMNNYIEFTRYDVQSGEYHPVQKNARDYSKEYLNQVKVGNEGQSHCEGGYGSFLNKEISAAKVRITKSSGEAFADDIVGVTSDRQAVEAYVICELVASGLTTCEED